jgi:hypothetical protein
MIKTSHKEDAIEQSIFVCRHHMMQRRTMFPIKDSSTGGSHKRSLEGGGLERESDDKRPKMSTDCAKIAMLKNEIEGLRGLLEVAEEKYEALNLQVGYANERAAAAEKKLKSMEHQVKVDVDDQINELINELLERELLEEELLTAEETILDKDEQIKIKDERIAELEQEAKTMEDKVKTKDEQIAELEQELLKAKEDNAPIIPLQNVPALVDKSYTSPRVFASWPVGHVITLNEPGKFGLNIIRRHSREDLDDGFAYCVVGKVHPNTQAASAGLLPGDVLCQSTSTTDNKEWIDFDYFLTALRLGVRPIAFRVARKHAPNLIEA